jgi:hypothetical protein
MHTLASELANEAAPVFTRNAAGLALKNALTARVCSAFTFIPTSPLVSRLFSSPLTPILAPTG